MIIRDYTGNPTDICISAVRVGVHGEYEYSCTSAIDCIYAEDSGSGGADKMCRCLEVGFIADSISATELGLVSKVKNRRIPERSF